VASKLFVFLFRCIDMISAISLASTTRALFFPLTCRESSLKDCEALKGSGTSALVSGMFEAKEVYLSWMN